MSGRARNLLRNPGGTWKVIRVCGQVLYIKPDLPPNVRKTNGAISRLESTIKSCHPNLAIRVSKARYHPQKDPQAIIDIGGVDLLVLSAPSQFDPVEVLWDPAMIAKHQIDKAKIMDAFEATSNHNTRTVDTSSWCK